MPQLDTAGTVEVQITRASLGDVGAPASDQERRGQSHARMVRGNPGEMFVLLSALM